LEKPKEFLHVGTDLQDLEKIDLSSDFCSKLLDLSMTNAESSESVNFESSLNFE
tara:strand:- start:564 stop:725 length:162 start_codon:yes stop_codon:yes gene_type:complete